MKKIMCAAAFLVVGLGAISAQELESPKKVDEVKTEVVEEKANLTAEEAAKAEAAKKDQELADELKAKNAESQKRKKSSDVLNAKTVEVKDKAKLKEEGL